MILNLRKSIIDIIKKGTWHENENINKNKKQNQK